MKKKIVALLLAGTMVISLSACGESESSSSDSKANTTTEETAKTDDTNTSDTSNETTQDNQEAEVPTEYKSALTKAKAYSETMHMSKAGLYEQLTSEYGEKFSAEAAQYAVDNVGADWNANALAKAKEYQDSMAMSPEAIRDQLTSDAGEKFTQEEADYAIANLN